MNAKDFISTLNSTFLTLHREKEDVFWTTYMGTHDGETTLTEVEKKINGFKHNVTHLHQARQLLPTVPADSEEAIVLTGWIRFFEKNVIESDEAKALLDHIVELENAMGERRRNAEFFYIDPETGKKVAASSNVMSVMLSSENDENRRKAAYEGILEIERFVLGNDYIPLVKLRNRFARALGFSDFMAFKCQFAEDMSKEETFALINEAVSGVQKTWQGHLADYKKQHGDAITEPWNFRHLTTGDLSREMDPYFPFADAVRRWVMSFEAMGISFNDATLTLDLLDRKGKHENGFMHGPEITWRENGKWHPARINFTSNANPKQIGSGIVGLNTLFHEGGHAAHFSNIDQPSPVFSHEFPPSSMAVAETQSMFLDALIGDGEWQMAYAKDSHGKTIPADLIKRSIFLKQPLQSSSILMMSLVSLFERQVYELPENELTPEKLISIARETEGRTLGFSSPRPLLSIPHLMGFESSCCYHGYLFAQLGVAQTRHYMFETLGTITNNPEVGKKLAIHYWKPGNRITFREMIESMTGKPLSAKALIESATKSPEQKWNDLQARIARSANRPAPSCKGDMNCTIRIVHGATVIADNTHGNLEMANRFQQWIHEQYA